VIFLEDDESCGEMDRELCTRGVEKIA
jgi:hypothetical protein